MSQIENKRKEFLEYLDKATEIVEKWPEWKRIIVSKHLSPYE
jgi:hypothetical protein